LTVDEKEEFSVETGQTFKRRWPTLGTHGRHQTKRGGGWGGYQGGRKTTTGSSGEGEGKNGMVSELRELFDRIKSKRNPGRNQTFKSGAGASRSPGTNLAMSKTESKTTTGGTRAKQKKKKKIQ